MEHETIWNGQWRGSITMSKPLREEQNSGSQNPEDWSSKAVGEWPQRCALKRGAVL